MLCHESKLIEVHSISHYRMKNIIEEEKHYSLKANSLCVIVNPFYKISIIESESTFWIPAGIKKMLMSIC